MEKETGWQLLPPQSLHGTIFFMQGYHARVGEWWKQDMLISNEQMLMIQSFLEDRWREAVKIGDIDNKERIAEIGTFFLVGYCGNMQGFEVPKIVLTELKHQMQLEPVRKVMVHIGLPLRGCFKARVSVKAKVLILIVMETASGLKPGVWVAWLIDILKDLGIKNGWLFQDKEGTQSPLSYFEEDFYLILFGL